MDSSKVTPIIAFKECSRTLGALDVELNRSSSGTQIDRIVDRATQSFQTALQSIQGNEREKFPSSSLSTTQYSPLQMSIQSIGEISAKRFHAQWVIRNLRRGCDDILTDLITQDDSESLKQIGKLFDTVKTLITTTQQRLDALSKEQEAIRESSRLLQEKKGLLTAFRQHCEELSQTFVQMCSRADSVDSSLRASSSPIEESRHQISLSAQQVSEIVQNITKHMEDLSRVESELQIFSTQSVQYARDVDQNNATISEIAKEIGELQSGFSELQTSMAEIERELAVHQNQTSGSAINSSESAAHPPSSPPIDGELSLAKKLFIWTLKAIFWYKKAWDHTTLELSIAVNNASQWMKHQITPYVGVYQAAIITNPRLWVATVLFILYWKGVLRKAAGCYMLGCAIFYARSRPMIENQAPT